jgi:hypothetical protein
LHSEDIKPLKTESAAVAQMTEGQFLQDGLKWNKGKSRKFLLGILRPIMSTDHGQDLENKKNKNK